VEHASASAAQPTRDLIVVIDDDESVRNAVHGVLRSVGLKARAFASGEEFLGSSEQGQTACVIADIQMPGMSGLELLSTLASEERPIPVIFISGFGTARIRDQARRAGAIRFLDKPFDDEVLLETIRGVIAA
jgi:FixJ family two-component response regulator